MMRHKIVGAGVGTLLLVGGLAEPLSAQEEDVVDSVVDDEEDKGGFDDWGLLGLLGLGGLAGLAKKRDDNNTHTATATRPAGTSGGSDAVR